MVAYLDVDMMPLRNIDELLAMDLKEGEIAMVSNPSSPGEFSPTSGLPKGPEFAFNGGLMVLRPSDAVAQQFTSFLDKLRGNEKLQIIFHCREHAEQAQPAPRASGGSSWQAKVCAIRKSWKKKTTAFYVQACTFQKALPQ